MEDNFLVKAWKIISKETPKFLQEMNAPFSEDKYRSVMAAEDPQLREKRIVENLLSLAPAVIGGVGTIPLAARTIAANPIKTAATAAYLTEDPTMLIPGKAGIAALGIGETQAAIRPGGNPNLVMSHGLGTRLDQIVRLLEGKIPLTNPSIAISDTSARPFQPDGITALMNPASSKFDPVFNRYNQLFPRDAYTARRDTLNVDIATDLRLTEGELPNSGNQILSIIGAPMVPGFETYETHKHGAKVLGGTLKEFQKHGTQDDLVTKMYEIIGTDSKLANVSDLQEGFGKLTEKAVKGDKEAAKLIDEIRSEPSRYAELKVAEDLLMDRGSVSAIMLTESSIEGIFDSIRGAAKKLNIPIGTAAELLPKEHAKMYDDLAESIASGKEIPDQAKKYFPRRAAGSDKEKILLTLKESEAFAHDVASILTTRDADEATALLKEFKEGLRLNE